MTISTPVPVVNTVAFAGIVGGSIVSVGLPVQKPFFNSIPVTIPLFTSAVAVGGVLHIAFVAVTVTSGIPMYPNHHSVIFTFVAALSSTTAFAVAIGGEIVRVGAQVQVPPLSLIDSTIPFLTVAVAFGKSLHFHLPVTLIGGAAT